MLPAAVTAGDAPRARVLEQQLAEERQRSSAMAQRIAELERDVREAALRAELESVKQAHQLELNARLLRWSLKSHPHWRRSCPGMLKCTGRCQRVLSQIRRVHRLRVVHLRQHRKAVRKVGTHHASENCSTNPANPPGIDRSA